MRKGTASLWLLLALFAPAHAGDRRAVVPRIALPSAAITAPQAAPILSASLGHLPQAGQVALPQAAVPVARTAPAPAATLLDRVAQVFQSGASARDAAAATPRLQERLDSFFLGSRDSGDESSEAGVYIAPNERASFLYTSSLRDEAGALVSVGTFRGLNTLARGRFSHLVQVDYDRKVVDFNRANARLLSTASSTLQRC